MTDRQKKLAILGCLLTLILAILDQQIVSTASVAIVRELAPVDGLERLPWLITAYALAATAALPLYGKLCDVYGAKYVYLGAVGVFLAGSALCGISQDMTQLIAFRALQGLGGGGLMSVTMVVFAHLTPPNERASAGWAGGLVAGLGMVSGPLIGGLFTDTLSWRWIFYINLPLGLFVLINGALMIKLDDGGLRHRIDYLGAALVAVAATVLLLVTEWGGRRYAWDSPTIIVMAAGGAALAAAFVWRQLTAAEPIFPLDLLRNRTLRVALPAQLLSGFAMTGSLVYTIVYLQTVRGVEAAHSGLYLIAMAAGMTVAGLVSGRLIARGWNPRTFLLAGTALAAAAMGLLATLGADTPTELLDAYLLLLGAGLGQVLGMIFMIGQNAVPASQLGVSTIALRFTQTLGMAFGTAIFGVVLNRVVQSHAAAGRVEALVAGIDTVYLVAAGVALASLGLILLLPRTPAEPEGEFAEAGAFTK